MRPKLTLVLALLAILGFVGLAHAEAKETSLKGTFTCAKCDMKKTEKCQNALKVKDGDKTVVYYLTDNEVNKKAHGAVCGGAKENITVVGTTEEKDGQKWITASKIEGL